MSTEVSTVKLVSSDGLEMNVSRKAAELSNTIKHMLDDLEGHSEVPLPSVKGNILKLVIEWCEYHEKNPSPAVPETDKYRTDNIPQWDQDFMKRVLENSKDYYDTFQIVLAANYLDAKELLELGLKTIANAMKGKTPEEIKVLFAIPQDKAKETTLTTSA